MGFRADIASLVQGAVDALGDIPTTFVFVESSGATYNPCTGEVSVTSTEIMVTGVLTRFTSREVSDINLLNTSRKALIPALQFGSVDPDALDDYVRVDGKRYEISRVLKDPAGALVTFHLVATED